MSIPADLSNTTNNQLLEEGNWTVMSGFSVISKAQFYYILDPTGERRYFYIDKEADSMLRRECNWNLKRILKNKDVPESIKDFIRSVIIMDAF